MVSRRTIRDSSIHTTRPTCKADVCPFHFSVYEDPASKRMFVRKYSGCDWTHKRHPHTERNLFRGGKRDVSAAHLETAAKLLENNMPTAMVDEWLRLVSGNKLSKDSIKSLRQSVMYTKHNSDGTRGTTAQKLIHNLQTTENCEYLILTGGYNDAIDKVRITKKQKIEEEQRGG